MSKMCTERIICITPYINIFTSTNFAHFYVFRSVECISLQLLPNWMMSKFCYNIPKGE